MCPQQEKEEKEKLFFSEEFKEMDAEEAAQLQFCKQLC